MIKPLILPGTKHGRLTVLAFERDDPKHPHYRVRCECGTEKLIQRGNLDRTHSCGCIKREMLQAKATHGRSHTPEWTAWVDMIARCSRATCTGYANYGGRGITVCERWREFTNFYADMGLKPTPKHTIDRIDNDGNYEPSNCRWATRKVQRVNQRRVQILTFRGVTGTLKDLAEHFGISYTAAHQRRYTLHWTLDRILTTPAQHRKSPSSNS